MTESSLILHLMKPKSYKFPYLQKSHVVDKPYKLAALKFALRMKLEIKSSCSLTAGCSD